MLPEGRYDLTAPAGVDVAVLVLHPHPGMGGDRFNLVVGAVFEAAARAGMACCRFDFSSSRAEVGIGEAVDALDLLPAVPVTVVGYSFGAAIAAGLVDPRIAGWVLIAPPFGVHVPATDLPAGADRRPKLVLVPAHDQWCPPDVASAAVAGWQATTLEAVPGTDHFLAGAAAVVAGRAIEFVRSAR